jgi:hypothetical protein
MGGATVGGGNIFQPNGGGDQAGRHTSLTSSPTSVSTRLGVRPRSWVPCISVGARYNTTLPADATCAAGGPNTNLCGYPERRVGLGGRRRHDPEDALGSQGHPLRSDRLTPKARAGTLPSPTATAACIVTKASPSAPSTTPCSPAAMRQTAGVGNTLELTKTWGGTLAFEHYWTPTLRTSWGRRLPRSRVHRRCEADCSSTAALRPAPETACALANNGPAAANARCADADCRCGALPSRTMWNPVQNPRCGSRSGLHPRPTRPSAVTADTCNAEPGWVRPVGRYATPSTTTRTGLPRSACSATSGHEPRPAVI